MTARLAPSAGSPVPRLLIVDDSAVARAAMSGFAVDTSRYTVAAAVPDIARALAFLAAARVDVIVLDLELPRTSGIDGLPALLAAGGGAPVLVVSGSAGPGAANAVRALALGAADTLEKPAPGAFARRFGEEFIARLDLLCAPIGTVGPRPPHRGVTAKPFDVVAIGASTGGIHALAGLFGALPTRVATPILVTQHLPPSFSRFFAEQVAISARRPCSVAVDHGRVLPDQILIAPGDAHLVAASLGGGRIAARLSREPSETGNLPSVDPMFASLAAIYGSRVLAIVLSGMGRDGLVGARAVRDAGGTVLVQDQASSVVWGMPGAVDHAGLANAVLTPAEIGGYVAGIEAAAA